MLLNASSVHVIARRHYFIHRWSKFIRWQDLHKQKEIEAGEESMIRRWGRLGSGMYISPERPSDVLPKKDLADQSRRDAGGFSIDFHTAHTTLRYIDHSYENTRRYLRYREFQRLQYDQRFIAERQLFLGPDLAAAHFLVHRNASVKFIGDDHWYQRNAKEERHVLPGNRVHNLYLEAIDASNTKLLFEGFDNLCDLEHVRMLRLANCPYANDWMLSRMTMFERSLEMLDLSGCTRITAKGLAGLRSLKKLRYLRLEGLDKVKDIAKTVLLLEKSIPNLEVVGIDFADALDSLNQETKLLSDNRIFQDAKGNAHVEDDNGRMFYIHGKVSERPVVDDDDKPIMMSLIRREMPEMPIEEFNRLDELSGGKLRHLLIGSPSGLRWSDEVERVLCFDEQWKLKEGYDIHPFLLPKSKRPQLPAIDVESSTTQSTPSIK